MPRIEGVPELGGNRVHLSAVDAWVEQETELVTLPDEQPSQDDLAIARQVCERIEPDSILQFGIGAIPDEIARILHTETEPEQACKRLVARANEEGGRDNITVILARYETGN